MGWGDELMAAGQARAAFERTGRRVKITDAYGYPRWHTCWEGNPHIARPDEKGSFEKVLNAPGQRPYHTSKQQNRWFYNPRFRAEPAVIAFTEAELAFGAQHRPDLVIEPHLKPNASPNKQWGRARWESLIELVRTKGFAPVQLGAAGTEVLPGVELIETPSFRMACAVLAHARAAVLHEGGLHHAAAAVGVPAVVLFGGFTPVELTGYATHRNLGVGIKEACGLRIPCRHCAAEMEKITPERVVGELEGMLEKLHGTLAA
jgi:ADP-heptose:LPS heptosyltransferase